MDETIIAAQSSVTDLIFIFHGYGTDKNDMHPLGELLNKAIPNAEIHIPNGLELCPEGYGRRWFPMNEEMDDWGEELQKATPAIMDYVDHVKNQHNFSYKNIIFTGFSQGAMISLTLGVHYDIKAVVSFSGALLSPEVYVRPASTKVLITHGSEDDVVPPQMVELSESILRAGGVSNIETFICQGVAHSISISQLERTVDFLKSL